MSSISFPTLSALSLYIHTYRVRKKSTLVSPNRIIGTILTKERLNQNYILLIKRPLERIKLA